MKRIRYVSQFAKDMSLEDIDGLIAGAAKKNARLDITGIIMSSGRIFFQVIEGPDAHIDDVYEYIVKDHRHRDVLLLDSETGVSERFFPDWSMKRIGLDDDSNERLAPVRAMLSTVIEKRKEVARLTNALERAVWLELAAALD